VFQREVVLILDGSEEAGLEVEAAKSGVTRVIRQPPRPTKSGEAVSAVTVSDNQGRETSAAWVRIAGPADVGRAVDASSGDCTFVVVECTDWKVIPLENLVAEFRRRGKKLYAYARDRADVGLAFSVLEKGVDGVVVPPDGLEAAISLVTGQGERPFELLPAKVTRVSDVGVGDRACVDTTSQLSLGEGMLVGSRAGFLFLVHGETVPTDYIATRPFRVNAGALHSYLVVDRERTRYLSELESGDLVLLVDENGTSRSAAVGRVKIERRPMVIVEASVQGQKGSVILQKAETVRLVKKGGSSVAVTGLTAGDEVLVWVTGPKGRHFGGEVDEFVIEK